MQKFNFINDGKQDFSDEGKIIYQFLKNDFYLYTKRKKKRQRLLFFGISLIIISLLILLSGNDEMVFLIIMIFGLTLSVLASILLAANIMSRTISSLGLAYIPITAFKCQDKSILIDRSNLSQTTTFNYMNLEHDQIIEIVNLYKKMTLLLSNIPQILSDNEHLKMDNPPDIYSNKDAKIFLEDFKYLEYCKRLLATYTYPKNFSINLNTIDNSRGMIDRLNEYNIYKPEILISRTSKTKIQQKIQKIDGIVEMHANKKEISVDVDYLSNVILNILEKSFSQINHKVSDSLSVILRNYKDSFYDRIKKESYYAYCPVCNEKSVKEIVANEYDHHNKNDQRVFFKSNTLMKNISGTLKWQCPVCKLQTLDPIFKHKMEVDLFTPIYDLLYDENYKDRLAIYNNISDEKMKYAEKAQVLFHEVLRESRTKSDEIKSKIRSIRSAINADEMTIQDLKLLLKKYKKIRDEKLKEIETDVEKYKLAIEKENAESKKRIDSVVRKAKQEIEDASNKYSQLEREDQKKRDQVQKDILKSTEDSKNILHTMGRASGAIRNKTWKEKAKDFVLGNEDRKGFNENETSDYLK